MAVPVFSDKEPGDGDEDSGLAELIPQYFALCRRDLENLRGAVAAGEFDKIRVLGHNLKGSGGAYGFPEISQLGSRLELAGKTQDESEAKEGIGDLAEFLNSRDLQKSQKTG